MESPARTCRDLRLLVGAVFLSAAGDMLALTTLALQVHELTHSGLAVLAFLATTMVPVVVLTGAAGSLVDRSESRRVLALASLAQAAIAVALALSTGSLPAILALSALLAAGSAISAPAEFALLPVVAGERLTRANGLVETARYAGFAAGPLVAALVLAGADASVALAVNAISFVAIAVAAGLLRARRPGTTHAAGARARDGVAHLLGDPALRVTVLSATGALLFISASLTVEVFYVIDVLRAGEAGYALMVVAWMLGMIAGALGLAGRIPDRLLPAAALLALTLQGLGMGGQAIWALFPVALAGFLVGGVGHGVKNTLIRTLIQRRVAAAAHGRAFAAYNAARNTAEVAALAAGGVLVTAIGPQTALIAAGAGPVVAGLLGLALLPRRSSVVSPVHPTPKEQTA